MDQSSAPWRVFEAPGGASGPPSAAPAGRGAEATPNSGLNVQPVALLGIVAAFLLGTAAVVIAIGSTGGDRVVSGPGATAAASAADDATGGGATLLVDVSGAVARPGLYRLAPGSRVGDAVAVAGGYGPRVDAERVASELNLAATVRDGDRIRVPSRDDPAGDAGEVAGGPGGQPGNGPGPIDLNGASQSELESLPGIGPVTATKIIAARDQAPFRSIQELRDRGLVGEKTFDAIKALITV